MSSAAAEAKVLLACVRETRGRSGEEGVEADTRERGRGRGRGQHREGTKEGKSEKGERRRTTVVGVLRRRGREEAEGHKGEKRAMRREKRKRRKERKREERRRKKRFMGKRRAQGNSPLFPLFFLSLSLTVRWRALPDHVRAVE